MTGPTAPTVVVTGASPAAGIHAAQAPVWRGWSLFTACRDMPKAAQAACALAIPEGGHTLMHIDDLGSLTSMRRPGPKSAPAACHGRCW